MGYSLILVALSALAVSCCLAATPAEIAAGQHVIYSYPGLDPPSSLLTAISSGRVGGIIFFGDNISSNISSVVAQLNDANAKSPTQLPLLLMTDQEGGEVRRLPGAPVQSAKQVGSSSDPASLAATTGSQAAQNLLSAGMNLNLAPVHDVYRSAGDFLDQDGRSYSQNASIVSACVSNFVSAQQQGGVAATAKHFPGLGAANASQNTDEVPVTIGLSEATLRSVDEAPYVESIAAGLKLVMPSWATYPSVDSKPSGLSSVWIQQELRGRLGFKGVTISDAIEAGGLQAYGDDSNRAVLATEAGMDIILASGRNASQGAAIVDALVDALGSGQLDQDAFSAATSRIQSLRKSL